MLKNEVKPLENLKGLVERVTYHNSENGFAVIKAKVRGQRDLVTVTGNIPHITVGEQIITSGCWHNNVKHGLQFKAEFIKSIMPSNIIGIEKYLGSGLIKGIGEHFAKKLVGMFGEKVFEIIEQTPSRLKEITGIGKVRIERITRSWNEQKIVREIMVFLQSHGVSTSKATRIFKTYGQEAIQVVSENPYQLTKDIHGIGFLSADKIARNIGIEETSLIRARAGITYALMEAMSDGHCALPEEILLEKANELLNIPKETLINAINNEVECGNLVRDTIGIENVLFLAAYRAYERSIADRFKDLIIGVPPWNGIDVDKAIPWAEEKLSIQLADKQKEAIRMVTRLKATVITGGPGTGKTTLVNSILRIIKAKKYDIKLCAPTGRAAKRLSESTGFEAFTIHRLLKFNPGKGEFTHNYDNPLMCDLLIVDESSMIDVQLMFLLLKALPKTSCIILVGDVDQLPSVGPGQILKDIIDSQTIPTVKLDQIFRQAATSDIIVNAHLVNEGKLPKLEAKAGTDFYFIESSAEELPQKLLEVVSNRIPSAFKLNPITDIQVLCPMQKGNTGVRSLNIELQRVLNSNYINGIERFGQIYSEGDKVMQLENDYDKEVYNGDMGFIKNINPEEQEMTISFDNRDVTYDFADLDQITIAYATTIHKSQGSEYPAVVIPITMQHYLMLKKNLVYTAITRGKKLVVLIGEKKALAIAVKSKNNLIRYSKLREFLS